MNERTKRLAVHTRAHGRLAAFAAMVVALQFPGCVHGQSANSKNPLRAKPNLAAVSLDAYLDRVRAENSSAQPSAGSIWTDSGRLSRMMTDVRAMRPHDPDLGRRLREPRRFD